MPQRRRSRYSFTIVALTGMLASVSVPARAQSVTEVQLYPDTLTLAPNQSHSLLANPLDSRGTAVPSAKITWSSSDSKVATVSAGSGGAALATVVGVGPGTATIEARVGSVKGSVKVTVVGGGGVLTGGTGAAAAMQIEPKVVLLLPSETRPLHVKPLAADGSQAAPVTVTWSSPNPAVATISSMGVVLGQGQGTAAIQATSTGGLVAIASIQVQQVPFGFPDPVLSLAPGEDTVVDVIVPEQGGRPLAANQLTWSSSDPSVVRVSPLGSIHSVAPGHATITASGFLQQHTLPVDVHPPIGQITVMPRSDQGPVAVPLGGTIPFHVTALTADGTAIPGVAFTWQIKDTSIASFDYAATGVKGRALGTTELTLVQPGPGLPAVTWTIRVVAGGLALQPARVGLGPSDTLDFSAEYTDSAGTPISAASPSDVKWTSSNPDVAQITSAGRLTAIGFGHARIIGTTTWGTIDTAQVFVTGDLVLTATRNGVQNLYTLNRSSPGVLSAITHDSAGENDAVYSPDGSRVAYVSAPDGTNPDVFVADADGGNPMRLKNATAVKIGPVWTPDGKHIVYTSSQTGSFQVWIMDADGKNPKQLTQGPATNFEPSVSPDGGTIAFTSTRDKNYDVYLMAIDGTNQRNVTQTPGPERHPHWFPDGDLGYLAQQAGASAQSYVVMKKNLRNGQSAAVSPASLSVTNFSVAPSGKELALEVSNINGTVIMQHVYFYALSGTGGPIPIPTTSTAEQQSSPAYRPVRAH